VVINCNNFYLRNACKARLLGSIEVRHFWCLASALLMQCTIIYSWSWHMWLQTKQTISGWEAGYGRICCENLPCAEGQLTYRIRKHVFNCHDDDTAVKGYAYPNKEIVLLMLIFWVIVIICTVYIIYVTIQAASYCLPVLQYCISLIRLTNTQLHELNTCWNMMYRKVLMFCLRTGTACYRFGLYCLPSLFQYCLVSPGLILRPDQFYWITGILCTWPAAQLRWYWNALDK